MLCPKCGRELAEGEICPCSSGLPEGRDVLNSAKNAAEAIKNSPFVSELLLTARHAFTAPEKQVADNSQRIDILWALLLPIEAAMTSFGLTSLLRRVVFAAAQATGAVRNFSEFAEALSEIGSGALKMFGLHFLSSAAGILLCIIAARLFAVLRKKKTGFSEAANLMTTVLALPSMLMAAAGAAAAVYSVFGLLAAAAAGISALLLGYRAAEAINGGRDKGSSLFRLYLIFAVTVTAVSAAMETGLLKILLGVR